MALADSQTKDCQTMDTVRLSRAEVYFHLMARSLFLLFVNILRTLTLLFASGWSVIQLEVTRSIYVSLKEIVCSVWAPPLSLALAAQLRLPCTARCSGCLCCPGAAPDRGCAERSRPGCRGEARCGNGR